MILKLQCSFGGDTAFPRDRMVITPHFQLTETVVDAEGLCTDLAVALDTWNSGPREITVKAYDAQGSTPVYPIGEHTVNVGAFPASVVPREVAVCLSYYSGRNIPRRRGRLYIPKPVMGGSVDVRPNSGERAKAGQVAGILANLGGPDVDWVVFSRADNAAFPVSNWWVDDEFDTVRSRGLRPTTRLLGTVNE